MLAGHRRLAAALVEALRAAFRGEVHAPPRSVHHLSDSASLLLMPAWDDRYDAEQVRLESDADAVTVVTIHKSKGLEYPIVYCPFLWEDAGLFAADAVTDAYLP